MESFGLQVPGLFVAVCAVGLYILWRVFETIRVAFEPSLRKVPGPWFSAFSGISLKLAVLGAKRSAYIHSLHEQYGPFVRIAPREIAIADIEAWRKIHRIGSDFGKGPWYQGQTPIQHSDETCGVFGIRNNKTASRRRRLFQTAGTKKIVAEWEPQVIELATKAVDGIRRDLAIHGVADVMKWWTFLACDVLGSIAFGESFDNVNKGERCQLILDIEAAMPFIGMRTTLPLIGKTMERIPPILLGKFAPPFHAFIGYGQRAVENTRRAIKGGNHTLFSKMIDEEGAAHTVPDLVIEQEAVNLIIAGTDTTAMTLTYLVYSVLRDEQIKKRLTDEVKTGPESPDWAELEAMPYLNRVITETFRLHPAVPASLPRCVPNGGETLGEIFLPEDTIVNTQAWTFHRDTSVFPDPLRFNPDRWESPTAEMKEHLMTFGGPARSCLGQNVARLEILHAVYKFFRECPDVKLAPSTTEESMTVMDFFTIKPKAGACRIVAG